MNNKDKTANSSTAVWILLLGVPIIVAIIYFKMQTDEGILDDTVSGEEVLKHDVAVPDTSVADDVMPVVKDSVVVYASIENDKRPAMEAGDEDGYWDGWYDAAETGEALRYDDQSSFKTAHERKVYAESYRDGYKKGFKESQQHRNRNGN